MRVRLETTLTGDTCERYFHEHFHTARRKLIHYTDPFENVSVLAVFCLYPRSPRSIYSGT